MTNYIFTELNNGDILFVALENGLHGKVVAIVAGWESQWPGALADALRQLAEDPTAYEDWDGQIEIGSGALEPVERPEVRAAELMEMPGRYVVDIDAAA